MKSIKRNLGYSKGIKTTRTKIYHVDKDYIDRLKKQIKEQGAIHGTKKA